MNDAQSPKGLESLCSRCQHVLQGRWKVNPYAPNSVNRRGTLHATLSSLSQSAVSCRICRELLASLLDSPSSDQARAYTGDRLVTFELTDRARDIVELAIEHHADSRVQLLRGYRLYDVAEIGKAPQLAAGADATSSPEAWATARGWISVCLRDHRCFKADDWHPTRLLDVGNDSIRLVEPPPASEHVYTTLSHCWGKLPMKLRLLTSNRESLLRGIGWDELPRLFQEAITVTRNLGIRYLWIDSLCIVQDSATDWAKEAAQMCDVYQHSYCNIAATRASNSQDTMFASSQLEAHPRVTTSWTGHANTEYLLLDDDFWEESIDKMPLHGRGWVTQERLLAPRVLHFGAHQLLWECDEAVGCQTLGMLPRRLRRDLRGTGTKTFRADLASWTRVVGYYSKCQLTQSDDKLAAIAGLAQASAREGSLGSAYIAGVWQGERLPELLAWSVADAKQFDGMPSVRRPARGLPTFSWASVDGWILHRAAEDGLRTGSRALVAYVDHRADYVHASQYMQVREAELVLRGRLMPVDIVREGYYSVRVLCDGVSIEGQLEPDEPHEEGEVRAALLPLVRTGADITYCLVLIPRGQAYIRWGLFTMYGWIREVQDLWDNVSYEASVTII